MRYLVAVCICTTIAITTMDPLVAQSNDPGPVEQVAALHAAMAAGDSAAVVSLLAPNVIIYESGGVESSRDEFASHHLAIDIDFAGSTTREILDQTSGTSGSVAWVLTTTAVTGTFRDNTINSRGTETMLLSKYAEGWLVTHIHWSSRRGG